MQTRLTSLFTKKKIDINALSSFSSSQNETYLFTKHYKEDIRQNDLCKFVLQCNDSHFLFLKTKSCKVLGAFEQLFHSRNGEIFCLIFCIVNSFKQKHLFFKFYHAFLTL